VVTVGWSAVKNRDAELKICARRKLKPANLRGLIYQNRQDVTDEIDCKRTEVLAL
jgi:hypothetical protein